MAASARTTIPDNFDVRRFKIYFEDTREADSHRPLYGNQRQQCIVHVVIGIGIPAGGPIAILPSEAKKLVRLCTTEPGLPEIAHNDEAGVDWNEWQSSYESMNYVWDPDIIRSTTAFAEDIDEALAREVSARSRGEPFDATLWDTPDGRSVKSPTSPGVLWDHTFFHAMLDNARRRARGAPRAPASRPSWSAPAPGEGSESELAPPHGAEPTPTGLPGEGRSYKLTKLRLHTTVAGDGRQRLSFDADIREAKRRGRRRDRQHRESLITEEQANFENVLTFYVSSKAIGRSLTLVAKTMNRLGQSLYHTNSPTEDDLEGYGKDGVFNSRVTIDCKAPYDPPRDSAAFGDKDSAVQTHTLRKTLVAKAYDMTFFESWINLRFDTTRIPFSWMKAGAHTRCWQDLGEADGQEWNVCLITAVNAGNYVYPGGGAQTLHGKAAFGEPHGHIWDHVKYRTGDGKVTHRNGRYDVVIGMLQGIHNWDICDSLYHPIGDQPRANILLVDDYGTDHALSVYVDGLAWCGID